MNAKTVRTASTEREAVAVNGWVMLMVNLALLFGAAAWFISILAREAR